jgi:AraC-like DNA-binding protein
MTGRINLMTARCNPPRAVPEQTVNAVAVRALVDVAATRGAKRSALLGRAGITAAEVANPHNRVAFDKYVLLIRAAKDLCGDPAFALHFGEAVDVNELSIVGAIGGISTLDDARAQMNRYGRLSIDVETPDGGERWMILRFSGHLWVIDARCNPNDFPELTESSFARMVCSSRRTVGDAMVKEIHVTHAEPAYRSEYERIFRVPVVFGSDKNAMRLDESALACVKPPAASRYMQDLLRMQADTMLDELDRGRTVQSRVEGAVMPLLQSGSVSIEAVGKQLGVSRQTLFRRLREEGVTFEQVVDALRHRLALHYLRAKNASVRQTAHLVGFSDASAFSRAFKRWTGRRPSEIVTGRRRSSARRH